MSDDIRRQVYHNFSQHETEKLLEVYRANDHGAWSETISDVIWEILRERHVDSLPQGAPAHPRPAISVTVPAEWLPPAKTPGLDGKELNYLGPPNALDGWGHYPETTARALTSTYAFTVTIPTDESVLAVRYKAEPQVYVSGGYVSSLNAYQFAYVLAPARAWDGFGGLDLTVHLPVCWLAASRPPLAHNGDMLTGSFDGIPADALALTVAPCDTARQTSGFCAPTALILPLVPFGVMRPRSRSSF